MVSTKWRSRTKAEKSPQRSLTLSLQDLISDPPYCLSVQLLGC